MHLLQQHVPSGVGKDCFAYSIPRTLTCVAEAVERYVFMYLHDFVFAVSFFLRKKSGAVSYQEFEVSSVSLIQIRVVDFVDYTMRYGEPNAALMAYGCAYATFST